MKALVRALFWGLLALEIFIWSGMAFQNVKPDFSWLGLVCTALAAFIFVYLARMPWELDLVVLGSILLDAFSDTSHLYSRIDGWDTFLHFLGGAVVAVVAINILERAIASGGLSFRNRALGLLLSVICLVGLFGTLYELLEYSTDLYYLHYQKQLGDGPDTVTDLVMNILGGAVVAEIYALFLASSSPEPAPPPLPPKRSRQGTSKKITARRSPRRSSGVVDLRSA